MSPGIRPLLTSVAAAATLVVGSLALPGTAFASPVTIVADPSSPTEIGARIRWGGAGFEASVFDNSPTLNQSPTLDPTGAPVWQVNSPYKFLVDFDAVTGALSLSVDFNLDNSFGGGESITRSSFNGTTSYLNQGFRYLSITGNEGGSTARSSITDLVINGTPLGNMFPNGGFLEVFYDAGGPASWTIAGNLTFQTAGTAQERPSWNFNFKDPSVIPLPAAGWMLLAGIGGIAAMKRRRKAA